MTGSSLSLCSPVHPHQLEVQEFASYALVIDARSRAEYDDDHIPGAVSLPVCLLSLAPPHSTAGQVSAASFVEEPRPEMPPALAPYTARLNSDDRVLVYCNRGGLDSQMWAGPLRRAGWSVDVLGGGWPNYRRWVDAGLEVLPRALSFRRLVAPPMGGVGRIISALRACDQQALDLAELADQRLIPAAAATPTDALISQSAFESRLLDALRHFDPEQTVFLSDATDGVALALPAALREALEVAPVIRVEVTAIERARAWLEDLEDTSTTPQQVFERLGESAKRPSKSLSLRYCGMIAAGKPVDALASLIEGHFDPNHSRAACSISDVVLCLPSLAPSSIEAKVKAWLAELPECDHRSSGQINP